ncbi:hypothetical protein ACFS3C_03885 [Azotobacter vinelandii]
MVTEKGQRMEGREGAAGVHRRRIERRAAQRGEIEQQPEQAESAVIGDRQDAQPERQRMPGQRGQRPAAPDDDQPEGDQHAEDRVHQHEGRRRPRRYRLGQIDRGGDDRGDQQHQRREEQALERLLQVPGERRIVQFPHHGNHDLRRYAGDHEEGRPGSEEVHIEQGDDAQGNGHRRGQGEHAQNGLPDG